MWWSIRTTVFLGLATLLLLAATLVYVGGIEIPNPQEMAARLRSFGVWGPLVVIGLMILHSFVPFPAELLAICAGAVFGVVTGSALIWVGAMLGALTAFALSRWLGQAVVHNWISEDQANTLDRWTKDQGAITLLVCRFIPVIAFNLINYAAGLTRVGIWTFVWTTGLGILPVTILSAYLGSRMKSLDWSTLFALSAVCILVAFLLHRFAKGRGWIS